MIDLKKPKKQLAIFIKESIYDDLEQVSQQMKVTKTAIVEYALTELFERQANEKITNRKEAEGNNEAGKTDRKAKRGLQRKG